ncbi:PCRF domain-containing protein, partial [Nocardia farcinica]|uniref:PCRF domain-containing protein n=1 Tax=Nocardia farcinica TaxID=37329 RepID=UPI002454A057
MTQPSAIDDILAEHAGLETQLADPALHNDPAAARRVGKRFAELAPVMATYRKLESARDDLNAARELAADDPSFAAEVPELERQVEEFEQALADLLAPRDPHDGDDVVLEVKSGEGGEESPRLGAAPGPVVKPSPPQPRGGGGVRAPPP